MNVPYGSVEGNAMGVLDKVKDMLAPDTEETVLYDYRCTECEATFTTSDEPSDVVCESCGADAVEEVGRMYAGGAGAGGAG
ncbi:MAG: zinc ribbon domain-containing protein [Haloferacaceae archaeon]